MGKWLLLCNRVMKVPTNSIVKTHTQSNTNKMLRKCASQLSTIPAILFSTGKDTMAPLRLNIIRNWLLSSLPSRHMTSNWRRHDDIVSYQCQHNASPTPCARWVQYLNEHKMKTHNQPPMQQTTPDMGDHPSF